jgi:hypothetical protein
MPNEDQLSLCQADQIRGDLYGIQDDIDFIMVQLAWSPTRREVARLTLLAMPTPAALVILWLELCIR